MKNVFYNSKNKSIEILLPFPFLGITTFYAVFSYEVPEKTDSYKAHLRKLTIIDKKDDTKLFSFGYRKATNEEIHADIEEYEQLKELQDQDPKNSANRGDSERFFLPQGYLPPHNQLAAYVDWSINTPKLSTYLRDPLEIYKHYLENKKDERILIDLDNYAEETFLAASIFINSLKNDNLTETWSDFLENELKDKTAIEGSQRVNESDFDGQDYYIPSHEIEDVLFYKLDKILDKNLPWKSVSPSNEKYFVISQCFENSYNELLKKISSIHYLSTVKEENARIYIGTNNSPFITLLKDYNALQPDSVFLNKYLKAFEIGTKIKVDYERKYQIISVSIISENAPARDLVDFGYGIKQLVLILIQISVLAEKNRRQRVAYYEDGMGLEDFYIQSLLLVEEPETNLHPKWQSLLAEMFAEANKEYNIQLIIETHSEYLIRKFQTLTAEGKIKSKNIKIFYLRNKEKITAERKQLETTFIKDDGSIDYTIFDGGFFDESHNLKFSLLNIQRDNFFIEFEELKKASLADSEKIDQLQVQIDDFTAKADLSIYEQIVRTTFDTTKLLANSSQYLISGHFLLKNINANGDFSPVIIQFGRTIEYELLSIFRRVSSNNWNFGQMQGSLEKFKSGRTRMRSSCNATELSSLRTELQTVFDTPNGLKIELLHDLREKRNDAAHPGSIKSENDALAYILKAHEFLLKWVELKK